MSFLKTIQNKFFSYVAKKLNIDEKAKNTDAYSYMGNRTTLFTIENFDGEKNLGEIGPAREYVLDYTALRVRSWQSYLESEITQTTINRF